MIRNAVRRRRAITIVAAAAGLPLLALPLPRARQTPRLHVWTGSALGASAMLQIHHPDAAEADRLIAQSLDEIARQEAIFSLYRPDSALSLLNRNGHLDSPPSDLVRLLAEAERFSRLTDGAFDATVQPLWNLYARHFSQPGADQSGPPPAVIAAALAHVGHDRVQLDAGRVAFASAGMAITLNGIAQGYITDRVVDLLRAQGVTSSLVSVDEVRAIGPMPSGAPWSVGLENPRAPGNIVDHVALIDRAVGTSGGYGTQFDAAGRFNHIFNPADGRTSWRYLSVSVIAPDAMTADALSTAFSLMPLERAEPVVAMLGLQAYFTRPDGSRVMQGRA